MYINNKSIIQAPSGAYGLVGYDVAFTPPVLLQEKDLFEYLDIIELSGITQGHKKECLRALTKYLDYTNWTFDKSKSLKYFKQLMSRCSIAYYKKQMYQIRKFLRHYNVDWVENIRLPADPIYSPKRVSIDSINHTLDYFKDSPHFKQFKALVLLGASSGLRAEELYQLNVEDIDLDNRIVYVNHNPSKKQTTKTQQSRISFFTVDAKKAIEEYFDYFDNSNLKTLFSQTHLTHNFRCAPIKVKYLRKFFSQEWDRRGGPTSIKKILMGHSLRNDVDLMHYNAQSSEDLKKIYNDVM